MPSALPERWIERIFAEMSATFGSRFADLWRGTDLAQVKAHWAKKLAGFQDKPEAIKGALDSLESCPRPPDLPEFLRMCRTVAGRTGNLAATTVALGYQPSFEELEKGREITASAVKALRKPDDFDKLGWAKRLRAEYLSGTYLIPAQILRASAALGEVWENRTCRQIEPTRAVA